MGLEQGRRPSPVNKLAIRVRVGDAVLNRHTRVTTFKGLAKLMPGTEQNM